MSRRLYEMGEKLSDVGITIREMDPEVAKGAGKELEAHRITLEKTINELKQLAGRKRKAEETSEDPQAAGTIKKVQA